MMREPQMADPRTALPEDRVSKDGGRPPRPRAADRVSEAADRLFYARGIRAVGVDEIVAQAGVTKPSLYRRFGSKDELVVACLEARFVDIMTEIDELEAAHVDDPRALVHAIMVSAASDVAQEGYRGCAVTNAAVEFPEIDHPTRLVALHLKERLRVRMVGIIRRLPTRRPELLTDGLLLLLEGAKASRHTSCGAGPAGALLPAVEALLAGFLDN